jgi:putative ABC transport system substrate-binding protein
MRRREFITLLGGAAIAWPRVVRAQQPDRIRRIGVLTPFDENDPEAKTYLSGFTHGLARLWRDQGKPQQARELLAPVYGWGLLKASTRVI